MSKSRLLKIKSFFEILGPGLITGAADDDPSGIATYSQAGAQFGFVTIWMALFLFPLMVVIVKIGNDKKILEGRTNGKMSNIVGWTTVIVMGFSVAVMFFLTWLK